eukprot:266509-Amphidinium_carterae.2
MEENKHKLQAKLMQGGPWRAGQGNESDWCPLLLSSLLQQCVQQPLKEEDQLVTQRRVARFVGECLKATQNGSTASCSPYAH